MDIASLRAAMQEKEFYEKICSVEECESTNLLVRTLALQGAPEGTVVFAGRQTAGRGRMGRRFQSPGGGGLYMSILLRPAVAAAEIAVITASAGVAVAEAVEALCGVPVQIKWVNDLLLGGKKFCGILTESVLSGSESYFLVLGVGINVYTDFSSFPPEVKKTATSICEATGRKLSLEQVAAAVLDRFAAFYRGFPENLPEQHEAYCRRLVTLGQTVEIVGEQGLYTALEVDSRFGLVVEQEGRRRTLSSGEVSVRAKG
ncbi:MAG: biotin--[acetyl-CoA-carboxylase] ligase [Provencibacterium sp.]|nr:biotin--[acetyl-CoA-carboxylase] ligase [Provencibacterium sp.]